MTTDEGSSRDGDTTAADDVPDDSLPSRVNLIVEGESVAGRVTEIRSVLPGYTLTTDSLPVRIGTPTSVAAVDTAWSVADCALATSADSFRSGTHVRATLRAEIDGLPAERSVQGSLPGDVALQLGLLAASSCPA